MLNSEYSNNPKDISLLRISFNKISKMFKKFEKAYFFDIEKRNRLVYYLLDSIQSKHFKRISSKLTFI